MNNFLFCSYRTAIEKNPNLFNYLIGMGQNLFSNMLFAEASVCFEHATRFAVIPLQTRSSRCPRMATGRNPNPPSPPVPNPSHILHAVFRGCGRAQPWPMLVAAGSSPHLTRDRTGSTPSGLGLVHIYAGSPTLDSVWVQR